MPIKKQQVRKVAAPRLPRGGTRGTLFFEIARLRLADATALLRASRYNCAIYIVGYAIECSLKWSVAVRRGQTYLAAELEHHNWDSLLSAAGLVNSLNANPSLKAVYSTLADRWHPSLRYSPVVYTRNQAQALHRQFKAIFDWIIETTR